MIDIKTNEIIEEEVVDEEIIDDENIEDESETVEMKETAEAEDEIECTYDATFEKMLAEYEGIEDVSEDQIIEMYLDFRCKKVPGLSTRMNDGEHTLKGAKDYINNKARKYKKGSHAMIYHSKVLAWVETYFMNEVKKVETYQPKPMTEEEKKALEERKAKEAEERKKLEAKKKEEEAERKRQEKIKKDQEMNGLDMFGF